MVARETEISTSSGSMASLDSEVLVKAGRRKFRPGQIAGECFRKMLRCD